jgi:signal transduction histidine kinase
VVQQLPDSLLAEIQDNGRGFVAGQRRKGLGLLGLRERAAATGGTLIIDSAPGHGTRIALRIPLAADSARQEINA